MGYNTLLFLLNDTQGAIDADPRGWWERVRDKIATFVPHQDRRDGEFSHGAHAVGGAVVSCQHADNIAVVLAGCNYATVVDVLHVGNHGHHTVDQQVALLTKVLDRLGYAVVKKPSTPVAPRSKDEVLAAVDNIAAEANLSFWRTVAALVPEAQSGDFAPDAEFEWSEATQTAIRRWIGWNVEGDDDA